MDAVGADQVYVAVQACTRIPAALLRFVLQEDINVHAISVEQLRQDIAVKGVVAVRPVADLLAVDIDIGV